MPNPPHRTTFGRLAGHAGKLDEILHGVGRFPVELLHDDLRGGDEVFRLAVIEADGVDDFLKFGMVAWARAAGSGQRRKFGRNLIHAPVRALRGKHRGDEQLPRVFGYKVGFQIGIAFGEQFKDFCSPLFVCHGRFLHSGWRAARGAATCPGRIFRPERRKQNHKIGMPKSQAAGHAGGRVSEETSRPCGSAVHSPGAYMSVSISSNSGETKMTGSGPCSTGACMVGFSVS